MENHCQTLHSISNTAHFCLPSLFCRSITKICLDVSYVRLMSKTSSDADLRNLRPLTPAPPLGLGVWLCARARGNVVPTSPQPTIGNSGAAPGAQQPTKETVDWLGFSQLCRLNLPALICLKSAVSFPWH